MKKFSTFLKEQRELLEAKTSASQSQNIDAYNTIASLGHADDGHSVLVAQGTSPEFMSNYGKQIAYDFTNYLKNFDSLDGDFMMTSADQARLSSIISEMPPGTRRNELIKQAKKVMVAPKSADRTHKTQQIIKQINQIGLESQGVDRSASVPSTFIPNGYKSWSNT
jgi:hypothetical protein